jgi:hypothetical protein
VLVAMHDIRHHFISLFVSFLHCIVGCMTGTSG